MSVSIAGTNTWEVGEVVSQFKVGSGGASTFPGYNTKTADNRTNVINAILRDAAHGGDTQLNAARLNHGIVDFRDVNERSLLNGTALSAGLATLPANVTTAINNSFTQANNTGLAQQLKMVARIIAARQTLGMRRQIFFCSIGGFDTHGTQPASHANLLADVSRSMKALYDATATPELNAADKVTSFTAADFGRTFKSNGSGTDHAWGNHHMVLGGAVKGGKLYGSFPVFQLGGPSDLDGSNPTGRWIPTTSVDEYSATFARWFGVPESAIDAIFPNLRRFPTRGVPFLA